MAQYHRNIYFRKYKNVSLPYTLDQLTYRGASLPFLRFQYRRPELTSDVSLMINFL